MTWIKEKWFREEEKKSMYFSGVIFGAFYMSWSEKFLFYSIEMWSDDVVVVVADGGIYYILLIISKGIWIMWLASCEKF